MTTITTTIFLAFAILASSYQTMANSPRVLSVSTDPAQNVLANFQFAVGVAGSEGQDNEFPAKAARLLQSVAANVAGENAVIAKKLFDLLNSYRTNQGVLPLTWNETAYKIAVNQTAFMVANNVLADDKFSYKNSGWQYVNEFYAAYSNSDDASIAQKLAALFTNSSNIAPSLRNPTVDQGAVSIYYNVATRTYFTTIIYVRAQLIVGNPLPPPVTAPDNNTAGENLARSQSVLALINQLRQSAGAGLSQLAWNQDAYNLAIAHAAYDASQGKLSNDGYQDRAAGWQYYAEVVGAVGGANDSNIAQQLFSLWNNSANVKAALLSSLLDGAAISVYYSKSDSTYYAILILVKGTRYTPESDKNVQGENKQLSQQLFSLVNQYRATKGLAAIVWNETAYTQAIAHSTYQAQQGRISNDNYQIRSQLWPLGYTELVGRIDGSTDAEVAQQFIKVWSDYPGTNNVLVNTWLNQGAIATYYLKATRSYYATFINVRV